MRLFFGGTDDKVRATWQPANWQPIPATQQLATRNQSMSDHHHPRIRSRSRYVCRRTERSAGEYFLRVPRRISNVGNEEAQLIRRMASRLDATWSGSGRGRGGETAAAETGTDVRRTQSSAVASSMARCRGLIDALPARNVPGGIAPYFAVPGVVMKVFRMRRRYQSRFFRFMTLLTVAFATALSCASEPTASVATGTTAPIDDAAKASANHGRGIASDVRAAAAPPRRLRHRPRRRYNDVIPAA